MLTSPDPSQSGRSSLISNALTIGNTDAIATTQYRDQIRTILNLLLDKLRSRCSPILCLVYCPYGNVVNEYGCKICACNNSPPTR
ncbi:unnamed protein product [Gordionus sp. m RMFG-2023]